VRQIPPDLIPEDLRAKIPQLEEASAESDPMVWVKLSVPEAGWSTYVIAMSYPVRSVWRGDDIAFYGWVPFWDEELKHFTLADLENLPDVVTRDETFAPCRLSQVMAREQGLQPKFPLGQMVATPGAFAALETAGHGPREFLKRHVQDDWGELDPEDVAENECSLVL
jgi:hypothetical protein